jgi:polar amino acid transport system substrate-binding protein
MRKRYGVLVGMALLGQAAIAETITIRADEWAPINTDPRMTNQGIMIDLATAIAAESGHKVDYRIMGWDDALAAANAGNIDCVVGTLKNEATENGLKTPQKPWVVAQQTAYARFDRQANIGKVADFAAFRVGFSDGYSYGDEIDQYIKQNLKDPKKIYMSKSSRPIRDLLLRMNVGQVDIAVETNVVMDYNLATANLNARIKSVGAPIRTKDELYIACSAKKASTANYLAMFDAGLPKMRASGKFKEILAKYNVKDWE